MVSNGVAFWYQKVKWFIDLETGSERRLSQILDAYYNSVRGLKTQVNKNYITENITMFRFWDVEIINLLSLK